MQRKQWVETLGRQCAKAKVRPPSLGRFRTQILTHTDTEMPPITVVVRPSASTKSRL